MKGLEKLAGCKKTFAVAKMPLAHAVTFVFGVAAAAAGLRAEDGAAVGDAPRAVAAKFFTEHCLECHSGDKPDGKLRLADQLTGDFGDEAVRAGWRKIIQQLQDGAMPPVPQPRPPEAESRKVIQWIEGRVRAAEAKRRASEGRVVLRRLNRSEYENTVHDLLGISLPLKDLMPLDTSAHGFDNIGDALHTSSFLLERYFDAADKALSEAIANGPQPPIAAIRYAPQETHQVRSTKEKVFRKLDGGGVVMFCSSAWQSLNLSQFYPRERGRYRFRISASAIQSDGRPVVFRVQSGGGGMGGPRPHLVSYFDAPAADSKVIEFIDHIEPRTTISILPYGLPSAQAVDKIGAEQYGGPGLVIDWIEVEGPLNDTWPPPSHRLIFGDLAQRPVPNVDARDRVEVVSDQPLADATLVLRTFIRRAYRRGVAEEELAPLIALVESKLAEGASFEQAVRVGLTAILTSPQFLFLHENPGRLEDYALASRLSYFLWSSMPDERLLSLAEQRRLSNPAVLAAQVERMLDDPRAAALSENFLAQWLGLRDIDFTIPSHILYPDFDDMLQVSMLRETKLFFEEVLRRDLSLTNFLACDFTMLNGRLAKHYGIPGVEGWEFRKVALPPDSHRGGVLTMASVLKVTANGTSTSPVTRGAWVLERILGTPPSPPPENVAALEPDIRGAKTIRQQLAQHRQIESCANCHAHIDPPGFALENFDVIGGWRDFYRTSGNGKPVVIDGRKMPYLQGPPVDPADELADGRHFENIDQLKQLLLDDKDRFAFALTKRLLTYATGGSTEAADAAQIEAIVEAAKEENYGFRGLIHMIVQSDLFRSK